MAATSGTDQTSDGVVETPTMSTSRYAVFAVVGVALLLTSVDQTVVATALPEMQADLHTSLTWSAWTLTVAALGRVLVMPAAGALADRFGGRRIVLGSVATFAAASLGCFFVADIWQLIALRLLQSLAGGAIMPAATGIVAHTFGRDRDRAIGLFTSIFPIGAIIGPVVGGVCLAYWSWRAVFLINLPICVAVIVLGLGKLPRHPTHARRADPVDVLGIGLSGSAILLGMLGITAVGDADGTGIVLCVVGLVASAGLVWGYVRRARATPHAIIPLDLLRGRGLGALAILNFVYGCAAIGVAPLVPLYARERYGIDALSASLLLTARAVGTVAVAGLATIALRLTGYRLPMYVGFTILGLSLVGTAAPSPIGHPVIWLAATTAVSGLGFGLATPASNNAAMQLAPEHVSAIAGIRGMLRQTGSITSVSITAAAVAASSRPALTHAVIFAVFGLVLLLALPLITRVPDHHGQW